MLLSVAFVTSLVSEKVVTFCGLPTSRKVMKNVSGDARLRRDALLLLR